MANRIISVIGLGYVGLPVAVHMSRAFKTIGFDINEKRISELKSAYDRTGEISSDELKASSVHYTADAGDLKEATFHIITVPTPVDEAHQPDLRPVISATQTVGRILKRGDIVVYESTVYPGLTEEVCGPILEKLSGLRCGSDFALGYSPERINPGDKEHTFTKIRKVVAGQNPATLDVVADVYQTVVTAGVFRAASIKAAEAAKVIENTQRDLNIALMNELAVLFDKMNLDTRDVLDAAETKWNFLKFKPGLVGGHCIGVDPYYLTHKAEKLGYHPQVILAGRRINDGMGEFIAVRAVREMALAGHLISGSTVTVLGLTFKENCPDIRNSKVIDIIRELKLFDIQIQVHDPLAHPDEVVHEYGLELLPFERLKPAAAVVLAVAHDEYRKLSPVDLKNLMTGRDAEPVLIDVKGFFDRAQIREAGIRHWRL